MESGQKIEADESKTHTISKTLSYSLSSVSGSSTDSSFELIVNDPDEFIGGTSDSLKKQELQVAGHSDSDFEFISGDDIGNCSPMIDLPSAAKISSQLSRSSSSSSSEPFLHSHVIELPKHGKYQDTEAVEPVSEGNQVESQKNLLIRSSISSSSSSESEPEIRLQQDGDNLLPNDPSFPTMEKDNRLVAEFSDDVHNSAIPGNEHSPVTPTHRIDSSSGSEVAIQSPSAQVMERADDPASPAYRIPSHVFSRNKSNTPGEWSVASNESLFSIHMGNMSFTREQLCWLGKSGELCRLGESPLDVAQPLAMKPSDGGLKDTHPNGSIAATEARAAETMREVIRENSENQRKENSTLTESPSQSTSISHQSDSSTKSFQFPILAGVGGKSISLKVDPEKSKHDTNPESPHPASSNPQTPKGSSSDESPKAAANVGPKKWFSCFSCCPFCS